VSASPSARISGRSEPWLPALIRVMARINAAATGPGIFDAIAQGLVQDFGIPIAAVWAHDPAGDTLHLRATAGLSGYRERAPTTLSPANLDLEIVRVAMTGQGEIIDNIGEGNAYRNPAWLLAQGIRAYAGLPLTLDGEGCGAISIFYREAWPPGLLDALHALAHQASLAIEHARLIEESQALQAIAAEVAASRNYRDLLQGMVQRTRATLGADSCAAWLLDEQGMLQVGASDGLSTTFLHRAVQPRIRDRSALFEEVARTGQPLYTRDDQAVARARSPELAALLAAEGIVCALRLPLFEPGGQVVGMLALYHHRERRYSPSEVRLAQAFTDQIAVALHNAHLAEKEREAQAAAGRQLERLQTITRITERLLAATEFSAVLRVVVEAAARLCGGTGAMVGLLDESGERWTTAAAEGVSREYFEHFAGPATDDGFLMSLAVHTAPTATRQALMQRAPVVVEDYANWPTPNRVQQDAIALGVRAFVVAPLLVGGEPIGALEVNDTEPRAFAPDDVALVQALADQAALAIQHARLVQRDQDAAVLEERTRLARDLHDSVTQSVFSLGMMARAAQTQYERGSDRVPATLGQIAALSQEALREMRALLFELQPIALAEEGLARALERLAEAVRTRLDLEVDFRGEGCPRLPADAETAIFRIVQEALANATKHAQATAIGITLEERDGYLHVRVEDNGVGFDLEAPVVESADGRRGGMGMRTMRERAAAVGLQIRIRSHPGTGTSVSIEAALPEEAAASAS